MEKQDLIDKYVTNKTGQVFAITDLPGIVGAVMARYSRASTGLRETLLREFIKEDKVKLDKAYKLIERVLIAYGDDSVGELEGAHLSFENISLLATKVIEHRRIGGSPIEQSTRYVRYDFKQAENGYHYYLPKTLGEGTGRETFRRLSDRIFDNYSSMWTPLHEYLERHKPLEDAAYDMGTGMQRLADMTTPKKISAFKRTYRNDIKTKVCDVLRAFLPLSTRANVGLFGNGRFFQHLISKMLTSNLAEANGLGQQALVELTKVIPHYVKRAKVFDYVRENERNMAEIAAKYFSDLDPTVNAEIGMIEPDHGFLAEMLQRDGLSAENIRAATIREQDLNLLAALVFAHTRGSFVQIRDRIKTLPPEAWIEIMDAYYGNRQVRRDRPERGIEHGYPYNFDLVTEWAVYKDLMRHRMGTIMLQPMAPDLGFEMPWELDDAGLGHIARETIAVAEELYAYLDKNYPECREYAMLQGHRVRWLLGMNDRALMHMLELRTAPQGHPNYREACQVLHRLAASRFPERAERMRFVNHEETYWSRGDSEARQRVKEAMLDQKHDGDSP
ncbi:MAG: FAD-dependent thymidylate synthase [Acidobacteriota bacterium]|nr:FAD-dependent thymidylate synthase [Acidobacteriota bacterium]